MNQTDEFIYNWANTLRKTEDGAVLTATRTAQTLKDKGYSQRDISDILVADDYDIPLVDNVVKQIFASEIKKEIPELHHTNTYVVPTTYDDVKPFIESTLDSCSAREFVDKLAKSEYPIMKISGNHYESFVRLASQAKENKYMLSSLHKELLPFIETSMYDAVCIAEDNKQKTVIASVDNDKYTVRYSATDIKDVFVKSAQCSCDKYIKGNYVDFGLACEHIVSAVNEISPNHKLPRNFEG